MSQFIEMFGNPVTNTKSWSTAKIKDVAPEVPSKQQLSGKVWLLNLDMIESNTGHVIEKVYEDVENALSVQAFDEGNVLFSKLRPYLNKVIIPDDSGLATTELVPLRPEQSKLHKVFLSHLLRGDQFVNYANDIAGGTKMPRMPLSELRNFKCILPPIDKQLQFVAIAEQADKSKFADFKSQFIEMFGILCDSVKTFLSDFVSLKAGKNKKSEVIKDVFTDCSYPCYGGNGIRGYVEDYTHSGIYCIIGRQGAQCGNVQIAKGEFYATEHAVVVTPMTDINPIWLFYALTQMNLNQYAHGAAQPGLAVNQLEKLPFSLPGIVSQTQFALIADQADKSKSHVHIAMIEIELHCNII